MRRSSAAPNPDAELLSTLGNSSLCVLSLDPHRQLGELSALKAELRDVQQKLEDLEQKEHTSILNTFRVHIQTNNTWKAIVEVATVGLHSVWAGVKELSVVDLEVGP